MQKSRTRQALAAALVAGAMMAGYGAQALRAALWDPVSYPLRDMVAMSRGGWRSPGFHAAVVYAHASEHGGYDVRCRIHISDEDYFHQVELGHVADRAEAVTNWGVVRWSEQGVRIGRDGPTQVFVQRERLEAHR